MKKIKNVERARIVGRPESRMPKFLMGRPVREMGNINGAGKVYKQNLVR